MKIRTRLAISFILSISIPLIMLGIISYTVSSRTIRKLSADSNQLVLQQVNTNIEAHLHEIERISRGIYSDSDAQEALSELHGDSDDEQLLSIDTAVKGVLYSMLSTRNDFTGIYIFPDSAERPLYVRKGYALKSDYEVSREPWYEEVMESKGAPFIIGSHLEQQPIRDPEMVFSLVRRIRSVRTGEGLGILLMNIKNDIINEICSNANFQKGSTIILYDREGRITYHNDAGLIGQDIHQSGTVAELESGDMYIQYEGEKSRIIRDFNTYTGMTALSIIPLSSLYQSTYLIGRTSFIIIAAAIAFGLLAAAYLAYHLTKPLDHLQQVMKTAESGDFSVPVNIQRDDEVGELAHSFSFMLHKINELIETVYRIKIKNQEVQLEVLQSKINPHFLYNTLEVIRGIALKHRAEGIIEITESLAHIFRYSIKNAEDLVPLREEIHYAEHYLRIQNRRFGGRLQREFHVDDAVKDIRILRFILQPILENSIIHGLEHQKNPILITIEAGLQGNFLRLRITDSGKGIGDERLSIIQKTLDQYASAYPEDFTVRTGVGLVNIQSRIGILFGKPYGIRLCNSLQGGAVTEVMLPAELHS